MNPKYNFGDYVTFVSDSKLARIIGITQQGAYFYRIQYHGEGSVDRVPEKSLLPAEPKYEIQIHR